jgi:predicted TIM-barrel fold metal-dependent hydrolase
MKVIDPHLHLFAIDKGDYQWLKSTQAPFWSDKQKIARNFSTYDIQLQHPLQLEAFVHIEAGFDNIQPWREIQWLQATNANQAIGFRCIASVDLTLTDALFIEQLAKLCNYSSVVGFRHILDDQAYSLLKSDQVLRNLDKISQRQKIFECQFDGTDTKAIEQLDSILKSNIDTSLDNLKLIINHAAFPNPNCHNYTTWKNNIKSLAEHKNLYIKASGWEMVDRNYQRADIQQVLDDLLVYFDEDKIMLASNFPLCLFSNQYQVLWQTYLDLQLPAVLKEKLMYHNAKQLYSL